MIQVLPSIPQYITVHLGTPSEYAKNVTVSFPDYVKNVTASEIYPTWYVSAIRANVLAIISFALNRVYTQFYRTRGYDFDITATTAYDQKFIYGRNTYENIDAIVDEIFTSYIRRIGHIEPLAAKFCNGTTTTCAGLSQWGSQYLAEDGYNYWEILTYYYGDDIEIVTNAPISNIRLSYPGTPLRLGDYGDMVALIQTFMNRISQSYPAIPKINPVNGYFGAGTEEAIISFQRVFGLTPDGIVGPATFNKILLLYYSVLSLSELVSEGYTYFGVSLEFHGAIEPGDTGEQVSILQFFLAVVSEFYANIPMPARTGDYDQLTYEAVTAFQYMKNMPVDGIVTKSVWDLIYRTYAGITRTVLEEEYLFPLTEQQTLNLYSTLRDSVTATQQAINTLSLSYTSIPQVTVTGNSDPPTSQALTRLQKLAGLEENGSMDDETRDALRIMGSSIGYAYTSRLTQYPGYVLKEGMRDKVMRNGKRVCMIGEPIRSLQTMLREITLEYEELDYIIPDGIYGSITKNNVMFMQSALGLPVTGVADIDTWNAIVEVYEMVLCKRRVPLEVLLPCPDYSVMPGEEDNVIDVFQAMLLALSCNLENINPVSVNGVNDEQTTSDIKMIQELSGIDVTGILDTLSGNRIVSLYNTFVIVDMDECEMAF